MAAGSFVPKADIENGRLMFAILNHNTGTATFTFQVQDDGGTANGGVDLDPTPNVMTVRVVGD